MKKECCEKCIKYCQGQCPKCGYYCTCGLKDINCHCHAKPEEICGCGIPFSKHGSGCNGYCTPNPEECKHNLDAVEFNGKTWCPYCVIDPSQPQPQWEKKVEQFCWDCCIDGMIPEVKDFIRNLLLQQKEEIINGIKNMKEKICIGRR